MKICVVLLTVNLLFVSVCTADTFTHRQTGESFDGFATQQVRAGKTLVRIAAGKASKAVNLSDYNVEWNFKGRRNQVIMLSIKDEIKLESATAMFEKTLENASNQGPLFIVIAIDTPGGRMDLMKRMCSAISRASNCRTVAYVCGGEYGGAYSAGAIISLACNNIYMADNTAMGAATRVYISADGDVKDSKSKYGETVGEKYMSADRAFVAAVAEENGRSGALAKAMVDKDIKVVEVVADGRREFIEPGDRKQGQSVVRVVNETGKLLTLTASDAVDCLVADGKANSMEELLSKLGAGDARVIQKNDAVKANREFEKSQIGFEKLLAQMDKASKEMDRLNDHANFCADEYNKVNYNFNIRNREELMRNYSRQREEALRDLLRYLRTYISLCKDAIDLGKRCPDLNVNVASFEEEITSAKTKWRWVQDELK